MRWCVVRNAVGLVICTFLGTKLKGLVELSEHL